MGIITVYDLVIQSSFNLPSIADHYFFMFYYLSDRPTNSMFLYLYLITTKKQKNKLRFIKILTPIPPRTTLLFRFLLYIILFRYGQNDPYQLDRNSSHHYQPTRQSQGITVIPEVIRNFLTYFQQVIAERNVAQILVMGKNRITDSIFLSLFITRFSNFFFRTQVEIRKKYFS